MKNGHFIITYLAPNKKIISILENFGPLNSTKIKEGKANFLKSVQIELTFISFIMTGMGLFFCNGCLLGTIHILREDF